MNPSKWCRLCNLTVQYRYQRQLSKTKGNDLRSLVWDFLEFRLKWTSWDLALNNRMPAWNRLPRLPTFLFGQLQILRLQPGNWPPASTGPTICAAWQMKNQRESSLCIQVKLSGHKTKIKGEPHPVWSTSHKCQSIGPSQTIGLYICVLPLFHPIILLLMTNNTKDRGKWTRYNGYSWKGKDLYQELSNQRLQCSKNEFLPVFSHSNVNFARETQEDALTTLVQVDPKQISNSLTSKKIGLSYLINGPRISDAISSANKECCPSHPKHKICWRTTCHHLPT
jgi:hypothetical protein